MNNNSRNQIVGALFNLLKSSAAYQTASRKVKIWSDVPPEMRPALFLMDHGETRKQTAVGTPSETTIECTVLIYTFVAQIDDPPPAAILDDLLDALDLAIAPDAVTNKQTLGGLCNHCWVEGRTMKTPGDLDGDGIAIVPIKILVPT